MQLLPGAAVFPSSVRRFVCGKRRQLPAPTPQSSSTVRDCRRGASFGIWTIVFPAQKEEHVTPLR